MLACLKGPNYLPKNDPLSPPEYSLIHFSAKLSPNEIDELVVALAVVIEVNGRGGLVELRGGFSGLHLSVSSQSEVTPTGLFTGVYSEKRMRD